MNKVIALWTHPRSISTAMERVMMERGDLKVIHEPFSLLYYAHEKRAPVPFMHDDSNHPRTYPESKEYVLAAAEQTPVFFKDMCYHCFSHLIDDRDFLERLENTFLTREPAKTIASHYAMNPDVSSEEIGYIQEHQVFQKVAEMNGRTPIVIDADDLEDDPEGTVEAYCSALGIPFIPDSLHWEPEHKEDWDTWREWHADAAKSTGIRKNMEKFEVTVHDHAGLRAFYDYHLPFYQAMHKHRLKPNG